MSTSPCEWLFCVHILIVVFRPILLKNSVAQSILPAIGDEISIGYFF